MTIDSGRSGGPASQINVTPMIDVLLVLLIIFMVIVPAIPRGEATKTLYASNLGAPVEDAVVLEVFNGSGGHIGFRINRQEVARHDLPSRLEAAYANRAQRVLFVKGDDQVSFSQVAKMIDIGRAVGVDRVGLMTPKVLAGR
jgi:biopolymer transport protein ExbD